MSLHPGTEIAYRVTGDPAGFKRKAFYGHNSVRGAAQFIERLQEKHGKGAVEVRWAADSAAAPEPQGTMEERQAKLLDAAREIMVTSQITKGPRRSHYQIPVRAWEDLQTAILAVEGGAR